MSANGYAAPVVSQSMTAATILQLTAWPVGPQAAISCSDLSGTPFVNYGTATAPDMRPMGDRLAIENDFLTAASITAILGTVFYGRPDRVLIDSSGNASQLTDLSGSGNHCTQSTAAKRLSLTVIPGTNRPCLLGNTAKYLQFGGYLTVKYGVYFYFGATYAQPSFSTLFGHHESDGLPCDYSDGAGTYATGAKFTGTLSVNGASTALGSARADATVAFYGSAGGTGNALFTDRGDGSFGREITGPIGPVILCANTPPAWLDTLVQRQIHRLCGQPAF